ncbi:hypothetical protein BKA62DRAFT_705444 [Auriculariales sp. MPI-PUGE-AT-0066]|nr:hypothetical protein BKA62DRAFT_705444 [Auriculariales sp. MPI-PUGE-AT-0066]
MAMNLILLRALNSSRAHARPMLALAFRGPIHAAVPRLSGNPIMCSSRLFSGFTPAPSPTTNPKPSQCGLMNSYPYHPADLKPSD